MHSPLRLAWVSTQLYGLPQQLGRLGFGPTSLDLARLEHGLQVRPQMAQLGRWQIQLHSAGLAGHQSQLSVALELEQRAGDAADLVANEQEDRLFGLASADVAQPDTIVSGSTRARAQLT
jgi:hypothetical protein